MIVKEKITSTDSYMVLNTSEENKVLVNITLDLTDYLTKTITTVEEIDEMLLGENAEVNLDEYKRARAIVEGGGKLYILTPSNNDGTLYIFRFLEKHRFGAGQIESMDKEDNNYYAYNKVV